MLVSNASRSIQRLGSILMRHNRHQQVQCRLSRGKMVQVQVRHESSQVANDDVYERKTPLEHVLLRPGMYIGSTDMITQEMYTFSKTNDSIKKLSLIHI